METGPTKAYDPDDATGFIRLNALRVGSGSGGAEKVEMFKAANCDLEHDSNRSQFVTGS
jgi:hypothetical protein